VRCAIVCLLVACATHAPAPPPALGNAGSDDECGSDDLAGSRAIQVYCAHVEDRCCYRELGEYYGWGCNNVAYLEWYPKYCASR
jgi:hypothetical protein